MVSVKAPYPRRARCLVLALCACVAIALAFACAFKPVEAWALSSVPEGSEINEDAPWYYADSVVEQTEDTKQADLMSATTADFGLTTLGNIGNWFTRLLYGGFSSMTYGLASWADEFMANISTADLFSQNFGNVYADAYSVITAVASNVIIPVANAFLGISFVFSLMSFTREAGMGGRQGTDLFASYMWIGVKYSLLSALISKSVWFMNMVFLGINDIGAAMQRLGGLGSLQSTSYADAFMDVCRSLTYQQGWGIALLIMLVAIVVLVIAAITAIYTQVVVVLRVFELAIRMAFGGFAIVMLGHQGTRESGMRYLKQFVGVCVQALVIVLIVGLGSVFITVAVNAFPTTGATGIGFFMGLVGPIVSCVAMFVMVKQSRDLAFSIVGA